jgi:hypothetical protein
MKIDLAIHSSDSNPFYLDFWPIVSKIWKVKFGVTPLLVYIDENHTIPIDTTYGIVLKLKPVPDIPVPFQCLWVRYWIPSQYPDKVSIISDIDMLPISRRYFTGLIAPFPDTKYIHLNPHSDNMPSCYHVAKGSMFTKVLDLPETWPESVKRVSEFSNGFNHTLNDGTVIQQWGVDEAYATYKLKAYHDPSIFIMMERGNSYARIDRHEWKYHPTDIYRDLYADSHSIRPYSQHKIEIDKLVEFIMEERKVYRPFADKTSLTNA